MALLAVITAFPSGSAVRRSFVEYSVPNAIAVAVLVGASFLDREARIAGWVVAIAVINVGMVRAGQREWLVRPKHFAERHGLIVIIALGEVIVALGISVVTALDDPSAGLPDETVVALVLAGVFAALLWWGYFDRPLPALEHRHGEHEHPRDRGRFARDVYTYAHCPVVAGVVMGAAALEEITQHPGESLAGPFRALLVGGVALYLIGVAAAVWRAFGVVAWERIVGAAAVAAVVAGSASVDGVVLLAAVDVVLALMLAVEHRRVERPSPDLEVVADVR